MKKRLLSIGICCLSMLFGISSCASTPEEDTEVQQEVVEATHSGFVINLPEEYTSIKGTVEYLDFGDERLHGEGIVEMLAVYYPKGKEEMESMWQKIVEAEMEGDTDTTNEIMSQMNSVNLFKIYGINEGRGIDDLIQVLLANNNEEKLKENGLELSKEEIEKRKENIRSSHYSEIGEYEGFNYILVTKNPEKLKKGKPFEGYEDGYFEEYLSLIENPDLITKNIQFVGGVELTDPVEPAGEGKEIHFEAKDLEGNVVKSEDLFAGHKVTMINLWGTWCIPCKRELSALEELNQEWAEKNCQIIGIVTDAEDEETIEEAKEILNNKGVTYVNLVPFEGLTDLLPQGSWPTSYFVDENGKLIGEPVIGAKLADYQEVINRLCEASEK